MVMNARNSSGDGSEHLVRDRVCPPGHLVGGNFSVALTAEENYLISLLHVCYSGNIQHSQIHAHPPNHRRALATHQRRAAVRKQPRITIGVADRKCRDEALALGAEGLTVTDARAGGG